MKKFVFTLMLAGLLCVTGQAHAAQSQETAPDTLIHVVTVSWKEGATQEQIQAALDGARQLPQNFSGIKRVWTKTVKAQGNRSNAIVMEFENEDALEEYAGSDAQKKWYEVYLPVRGGSTTFDITN